MSLRRVLVANRGEIARRVIHACHERGLEAVAVCSTADADSPHTRLADRRVVIGGPHPQESYLHIARLIDAAREADADAVHPGYGFLSESPEFAEAVSDAGLAWVGPPASVIASLGSKIEARRLMQEAGVPVVPGETPDDQSDAGVIAAARRVGAPLLVKASAGGGGRGMRIVHDLDTELSDAVQLARREATAAFGDGTLYVERLFSQARHVEVQVLADDRDSVVHLYERDCSLQRRHQKIIEESPAPELADAVRRRLTDAAVAAARAAGYRNAGTVEFLVDASEPGDDAPIAFLEMNTRLQVEHPITEAVTGRDLVHAQLAIAAGEPLPWRQEEIAVRGHAVECRVYAEDPEAGFRPDAGPLLRYEEPTGPGLRVDAGVEAGSEISSHYDGLLAKVVSCGEDRQTALARARVALARFVILGVATNLDFLQRTLEHTAVRRGPVDTSFVEAHLEELTTPPDDSSATALAAALAVDDRLGSHRRADAAEGAQDDLWTSLGGWRLT